MLKKEATNKLAPGSMTMVTLNAEQELVGNLKTTPIDVIPENVKSGTLFTEDIAKSFGIVNFKPKEGFVYTYESNNEYIDVTVTDGAGRDATVAVSFVYLKPTEEAIKLAAVPKVVSKDQAAVDAEQKEINGYRSGFLNEHDPAIISAESVFNQEVAAFYHIRDFKPKEGISYSYTFSGVTLKIIAYSTNTGDSSSIDINPIWIDTLY